MEESTGLPKSTEYINHMMMKNDTAESGSVGISDPDYPSLLKHIPNPPRKLYYAGRLELLRNPLLAIVGSRRCTQYGRWTAESLAGRMSDNGITVVSGMAFGIDEAAHRGALKGIGSTIAVLACGIDVIYPKAMGSVRDRILKDGLLLTEVESGITPRQYSFPQRNRIISGLARATVVIEAGLKSGSLITAEHAADQGRDVYAVPGNIDRQQSHGCNKLIHDGAKALIGFNDIIYDWGLKNKSAGGQIVKALGKDERAVYSFISENGESNVDDISRGTGLEVQAVSGIVTVLEMKGFLHYYNGRIFCSK